MSLLKRLGRTKEQAIKEVENRGTNLSVENRPEQVYGDSTAPRQVKSSTLDASQTYSRLREQKSSEQPQMASAFAARRSAVVQIDQIQELRLAIHRRIVDEMTVAEQQLIAQGKDAREQIKNLIATYLEREMVNNNYNLSRAERMVLVDDICDELLGLGPLEPLLKDNTITEIMVNGPKDIFVERNGKLLLSDTRFYDDNHLMNIIERILAPLGRRVDEASPLVDARLADGSRVNIIIPPLSLIGPTVTIRKFSKNALSVENLVDLGTLSEKMAMFLQACVKARLNILVAGGTGSGKTTTLNVLSSFIPANERIVTIEDAAELRLQQRHVVTLESRPANIEGTGAVTIRDLVRNALRMRPDRIIVGEVRSGEALDMLQAMNTGHDGSITTAHANSPRDVLSRLETMTLMAGMELPVRAVRTQIGSAINLIIQQSRLQDGSRKLTHITEVQGMDGDTIILQDLFRYVQDYLDENGKSVGHFETAGFRPTFMDKFRIHGIELPQDLFQKG